MFPVTKWSPIRELGTLQREMDELFGRLMGRTESMFPHFHLERGIEAPPLECVRKGDNLLVKVELPGMDPKDVDISVTGNLLTIKGERKLDQEVKEEDYYMREIGMGRFERTLTLPEGVETEKIKANYKNGILLITMPAEEVRKSRKVEIEVGEEPKKLKAA